MNKLLFLLIFLFAFKPIAAEGISGAFGIKLGDIVSSEVKNDTGYLEFEPDSPNEIFNKYTIQFTPISKQIYKITARTKLPNVRCTGLRWDELNEVLNKKYYKYKYRKKRYDPNSGISLASFIFENYGEPDFMDGNNTISIKCESTSDEMFVYRVEYTNTEIEKLVNQERKKLRLKKYEGIDI